MTDEQKIDHPIFTFIEKFGIACAILSVLAENRLIAQDLFQHLPEIPLKDFEKNALIVLKYLEQMEK